MVGGVGFFPGREEPLEPDHRAGDEMEKTEGGEEMDFMTPLLQDVIGQRWGLGRAAPLLVEFPAKAECESGRKHEGEEADAGVEEVQEIAYE